MIRKLLPPIGLFVIFLMCWHLSTSGEGKLDILFPGPYSVFKSLFLDITYLFNNVLITLSEAITGFVIAAFISYFSALLFSFSNILKQAVYPYSIALKSTPLVAIAPLIILWLGDGFISKSVMAALVAFFPILVASIEGLSRVSDEELAIFSTNGSSRIKILLYLRIPKSLPSFFDGLKIASSLSLVGAVIAEFTGASRGIGYVIKSSAYYLDMPAMYAGIILLSLTSVGFFYTIIFFEKIFVPWQSKT